MSPAKWVVLQLVPLKNLIWLSWNNPPLSEECKHIHFNGPINLFYVCLVQRHKILLKASEPSHVCTSQWILEKTFQQNINFQRVFLIVFSIEKASRKMHWDTIFVANGSYKWIWWVVDIRNVLEVSMKLFMKIVYLPWTFRLNVACFHFVEVIRDVQVFLRQRWNVFYHISYISDKM